MPLGRTMKLGALPYHEDVAGHLQTGEAALWSWFESDQFSQNYADRVKLELLKSTYRLTRADHADVYALADTAAERLSLDLPVTVYQGYGGKGVANAELDEADGEQAVEDEATQLDRSFYAVDSGAGAGSHDWELDLCAVTLANFNYRKMTLVRDYNDFIGSFAYSHATFDLLFSDEGRPAFEPNAPASTDYMVLPADPSQAEAVARASAGESYVIQGPPGTGKSQTITNLIADYVARGKGVLFVCEKRAALDVVFHRLKQSGLGDVSTLIHDSQGDKKAFIGELKVIYEAWTSKKPSEDIAKQRQTLTGEVASRLAELERFSSAMTAPVEPRGPRLRDLIEERLKYGPDAAVNASEPIRAALPGWQAFQAAKPVARMLRDALSPAATMAYWRVRRSGSCAAISPTRRTRRAASNALCPA